MSSGLPVLETTIQTVLSPSILLVISDVLVIQSKGAYLYHEERKSTHAYKDPPPWGGTFKLAMDDVRNWVMNEVSQ